jgi:hypothetical protein
MSDLRAMLSGSAAGTETTEETPATDATEAASVITEPDSEPDVIAEVDAAGEKKPEAKPDTTPAGVQKRIDKAVKAQREAERRAEALEARLAETTESRPAPAKAAEIAPPVKAPEGKPGKPEAKNFDTYEAFNESLMDWKLAQTRAADAKTESDRKAAEEGKARGAAWNKRVEAAKELPALADFDDVMLKAAKLPISEAMHASIFDSDRGPELAYHLASHPEEATRIAKLAPLAAARELGKIEASLGAAVKTSAKPAAKPLPKPPAQAGGSHAPSEIDLSDDKLSPAQFAREFRKRFKKAA